MNIKNNKRRRESVEKIHKVFIELLQEKELDKISVSDICKLAELNRSTFYANFIDIYDLAARVKQRLEEDFLKLYADEVEKKSSSHNFLKLFTHIKENQLFYKTYFKLDTGNNAIIGYDIERAQQYFSGEYIDYHIEFFKSGFNAVVKKWLNGGCIEAPEEMEQIIKSEYLRKI